MEVGLMKYDNYVHEIIDIIESDEDCVKYDYNSQEDQILLLKELVVKLLAYVNQLKNIEITPKDLLDLAIREAFELSKSDLILSKKGYILLKLIDESKIKKVAEEDKKTIANRYSGIDESELESFYDEFIEDTSNENFFLTVAKEFIDKYLHEEKITNEIYEKNVFGYIQDIIFQHLVNIYDNEDNFFNGFAGYVFRIHFKEVFENIADGVLVEVATSNFYVIDFLKYYESNIIVLNGEKYKVPHIESDKGLRWTIMSMLSIAKVYTKAIKSIVELKKEILELDVKVKTFYIANVSPIVYYQTFLKSKVLLEQKIERIKQKVELKRSAMEKSKDKTKIQVIETQIRELRIAMNEVTRKYDDLLKKEIPQSLITEYKGVQSTLDSKSRILIRDEKIILQNEEQYISIRTSLVKALIAKKKKV